MRALKMPFPMKRSRQQQQSEDNQQHEGDKIDVIIENKFIILDEFIAKPKRARIDPKDLMEQHKSNENQSSSSHSNTPPEDPSVSTVKNNEPTNGNF